MNDKWKLQNKKGCLKIHVAVDIKTKEILALEVTDEKVQPMVRMLRKLVNRVINSFSELTTIKIKSALADGAYDSNSNFGYLEGNGIMPGIKIRRNSIISIRNNRLRNKEVMQQTKDLLKWERKRKYRHRWIAETAFSSIKRMFGEHVVNQTVSKHVKRDDDQDIAV